jgi:hypothetical protein
MSRSIVFATLALVVAVTPARSQVCTGHPSWDAGRYRAGVNYANSTSTANNPSANKYGGDFAFGFAGGAFASAALMHTSYEEDPSAPGFNSANNLAIGAGIPVVQSTSKAASFCPIANVEHQWGPNGSFTFFGSTTNLKVSSTLYGLGGSVGGSLKAGERVDVVPFGSAQYAMLRATVSISGGGQPSETDHESVKLGLLEFGAGIVINKSFTIRPSVQRAVGLGADNEAGNVYLLAVGWSFGK